MPVKWTPKQQQVIDLRDRNLLVSAAAGSGKTAVLVERILSMIKDPVHPIDIDQLLVVTFTRAAAGEMKERIGRALSESLEKDPDNVHLQRQQTLLHHAEINTIHGFCSGVIRNYFQLIDLDPVYRMADEGEIKLMKKDVVGSVIEDAYASENPQFLNFVESYTPGRTDGQIDDLILSLYEFSMSYPWPEEWLEECLKAYEIQDASQLCESPWMKYLMEETRRNLESIRIRIKANRKTAQRPDGPYLYDPMLAQDECQVEGLLQKTGFDELVEAFAALEFPALSRKKDPAVNETLKEQVKQERDNCKKLLKGLAEQFFGKNSTQILSELETCRGPIKVLVELTREFGRRFAKQKRSKNLMDFSDLEHFALQILVKKEDGKLVRTEAAKELSDRYFEIMTDEYQDSNFIQEALLLAVSKEEEGKRNRFMVGDIKQSIYGFRLARPELFLEKYHSYSPEDGKEQRIDLYQNFRSRAEVLTTVNTVFSQIMTEELGGIAYDEQAKLHPGAQFPEGEKKSELILIDREDPDLEDDREKEAMMELEASVVAKRIRDMVGTELITDQKTGEFRPVQYRDIVILLRTVSGWGETFARVLQSQGIPVYTASRTGYFSAIEVVTVLNYLHICDNPMQEIPFTAILRSPIVGCTDEELAKIRCVDKELKIYEACGKYARSGEDSLLRERLSTFLEQLEQVRSRVLYTPIHELILQILDLTGYEGYASAMPGGIQRRANLQMLVEKAVQFESTSYRGLFNFIRYMEQLQKYEVDFGEVSIYGESADTVRIMSIHKSKGLEFPVVFLSGTGKKFNQSDSRALVTLHSGFGIGTDAIDPVHRVKAPTLRKQVIRQAMQRETMAEEQRVLYVGMTRAKEKLILTGTAAKLEEKVKECAALMNWKEEILPYQTVTGASCYLDYLLAAFARYSCFEGIYQAYGAEVPKEWKEMSESVPVEIQIASPRHLVEEELLRVMEQKVLEEQIRNLPEEQSRDEHLARLIEERFGYRYPYENLQGIPVKMTVSQLKKSDREETETGEELYQSQEIVPILPTFVRKENPEALEGADRGTAYHRFLECLDFGCAGTVRELACQLRKLVEEGRMKQEEADCIYLKSIAAFASSRIGKRMKKAFEKGTLRREQPFVMEISAKEADPSYPEEEKILIQGIIDAWFPEGDGLVIVDYKTDRVTDSTGRMLVERYEKQLDYYREALERLTGQKVKERCIYSLSLGKEILL
ncbi:MAG: helicase-exonuclease AddAB subunit AddA [Fusicatenibacter sp.]|nr:helicase-exonuclease AddAB subunit AddA [Lachnospiraceae bacterium]MDY2938084.1 helicase-exonuclease AddAB subunit AddA [Fusicatenibacter sp.]